MLFTFIAVTTFPIWLPCLLHGFSAIVDLAEGW
jgi:hypothetical protein